MKEIILIDKPKGITSFDVIRQLRRRLNIKKMGHAGTLDPLASGLMIIGIEKGTKKLNEFLKLDKVYEVEVLLGVKTDTGDLEGKVLEDKEIKDLDMDRVKKVLAGMVGELVLPVPVYSAIKSGGEALYKKARRGEKVDPPQKEMRVYKIKLLNHYQDGDKYVLKLEMKVSSGTYVRSLAEEIGDKLGVPATVKELRRTQVGEFKIEQAVGI